MDALASSLERSPELFPHAYDLQSERVSLVRLTRGEFERASFLDQRALAPHTLARTLSWNELSLAVEAAHLVERCNFIFHMGHVGSTLLSRLLGAYEEIFALREPAILRTLAEAASEPARWPRGWQDQAFEKRISVFLRLWSRTFEAKQTTLVKATSFVSEIAPAILARPAKPKAILLFVRPEAYMATILGGPNAREEAKSQSAVRLKRLARRLGREVQQSASLSEGEALALGWATEMSALVAVKSAADVRAILLDFDTFLAEPGENLSQLFRHLGCRAADGDVARILSGPHMQRYSKAPEHAFSPALRNEILDDARKRHGAEIAKGLSLLSRAADEFPIVRECLAITSQT